MYMYLIRVGENMIIGRNNYNYMKKNVSVCFKNILSNVVHQRTLCQNPKLQISMWNLHYSFTEMNISTLISDSHLKMAVELFFAT
jgi:hypothetical protein